MSNAFEEETIEDDFELPRKKRVEEEMDITPMIDITFLLLIFFVVCSKMDPTQMADIPEADNGVAVAAKKSAVIFVEPAGEDKVILKLGDGTELSTDEETQAVQIVEFVTKELFETTTGTEKDQVLIMGDQNVKVAEVTRIQKIIGDAFNPEDVSSTYIAVKEN